MDKNMEKQKQTYYANIYFDGAFKGRIFVPKHNTQEFLDGLSENKELIFSDGTTPFYGKKITSKPVHEWS